MNKYQEVLCFWFEEVDKELWFKKSDDFDQEIKNRFFDIHQKAVVGELSYWRDNIYGRLAEIIVIDQFSRNMFRNNPKSFAYDNVALVLAQEAIKAEDFHKLTTVEKSFLYLPFMHSESKEIHKEAVKLYSEKGLEYNYDFELKHKEIIDRFGRYPHRNEVLGRISTAEELEFLKDNKGF
ncbi:DUF924 domain-containing protein [Gemella sp. GH3]|uniref:DUF924 family protein n=1 Tax=unclassified Gemella TaxID=2624949 RepID=UPI0015D08C56|nr:MULTISPECIES: DUF924 family protein [unclassified Gemella]MBF0713598.1 DUF924 domain-containing protein [Gemella sp. GH3.1]NYS50550.1 DUF924 domain-containing protein [Gemella sp. GH3]